MENCGKGSGGKSEEGSEKEVYEEFLFEHHLDFVGYKATLISSWLFRLSIDDFLVFSKRFFEKAKKVDPNSVFVFWTSYSQHFLLFLRLMPLKKHILAIDYLIFYLKLFMHSYILCLLGL